MLDITERLIAARTLENSQLERICYHCWHSTPKGRRWVCHLCGEVADQCMLDYYVMGRRLGRDAARTSLVAYDQGAD